MGRIPRPEKKDDWFYTLIFHIKRGPVIVKIADLVEYGTSIAHVCSIISNKTPRYVDYYPGEQRAGYVLLAMEGDR